MSRPLLAPMSLICACAFLALGPTVATAAPSPAPVRFEHLTLEDGLSENTIRCITQDSRGFLWVGTRDGLNRYDGQRFTTYQLDPDTRSGESLHGNWIGAVMEDHRGDLWIALGVGGVELLDHETGLFHYYFDDNESPHGLEGASILNMCETADRSVWMATETALNRFRRESGDFVHYLEAEDGSRTSPLRVRQLLEDSRQRLWVATFEAIYRYRSTTDDFERFAVGDDQEPQFVFEDRHGTLWAGDAQGCLYRFATSSHRFELVAQQQNKIPWQSYGAEPLDVVQDSRGRLWIRGYTLVVFDPANGQSRAPLTDSFGQIAPTSSLLQDSDGSLWVGTHGSGLFHVYPQGRIDRHVHRRTDPKSLGGDRINCLFQDQSGLLWIGIAERGLDKFDSTKQAFVHVQHDPIRNESLPSQPVSSFAEGPPGVLWAGTLGGGLFRQDLRDGSTMRVSHDPDRPGSLPAAGVMDVHVDDLGQLWVATWGAGLAVARLPATVTGPADLEFEVILHENAEANGLSDSYYCIEPSASGKLWLGMTSAGLALFDPRERQVEWSIGAGPPGTNSLAVSSVWCMLEDRAGILWVGTPAGSLHRVDPSTREVRHFPWNPGHPDCINNRTINSLHEDTQGRLWVGTYSGGLNLLDRETGTFSHFTRRQGLPSNMINGILEEEAGGALWLATNRGLCRFDPASGTTRNYDRGDGLQSAQFSRGAAFVDHEGAFLVGGINGYNRFHPEELQDNQRVPPVLITSLRVFDRGVPLGLGGEQTQPVVLSHQDDFLSFDFAALDFTNPAKNQYAYKLHGLHQDWMEAEGRSHASFTNLDPGDYVFQVIASNNDGAWNHEGAKFAFTIQPPFWQTWWFRALAILTTLLTTAALYRARVRRIETDRRHLKRRVAEKTEELVTKNRELQQLHDQKDELVRIAAHDMRTPLTSTIGYLGLTIDALEDQSLDPVEGVEDLSHARSAAVRVSQLLTEMLDASAIESGTLQLDVRPEDVGPLLVERSRFHERLALQKGIRLHYDVAEACPPTAIDRSRIAEVVDNLLSNAIKYTYPGGSIRLRARPGENEVVVSVQDTGQGLTEEDLESVFGSYRRLSARPTGGESSTGLGLAIVKKIVELHHGRVWVDSLKGHGSTFGFSLPAHQQPVTPRTSDSLAA